MSVMKEFSYIPILFGIAASIATGKKTGEGSLNVDFAHLSERAMLYVVFTFGEMVIDTFLRFIGSYIISDGSTKK